MLVEGSHEALVVCTALSKENEKKTIFFVSIEQAVKKRHPTAVLTSKVVQFTCASHLVLLSLFCWLLPCAPMLLFGEVCGINCM